MPLAIAVVATGARPGDTGEKRELFSEETETVLVFETGGVIRLSAAVAVGQLIFLTNKQTGKEVVTQVLQKRSYRPTACYIELDFTEPAAGVFGVEFSAAGGGKAGSSGGGNGAAGIGEAGVAGRRSGNGGPPPGSGETGRTRQ